MSARPVDTGDLGHGPMIMGTSWTVTAIAIIAVVLRMFVRKEMKSTGWDDWLMCGALVFQLASQSCVTVSFLHGLGKHDASYTSPQQEVSVLKWMWIANPTGLMVSVLARSSIAILLVRLFGVHRWFKWFVIIVTAMATSISVASIPCVFLQATPISGVWNPFDTTATHWDPSIMLGLMFTTQALWTFIDLSFVLLPVIIIWRLQMALHQRLGLMALMAVSLLTMVMSILKTVGIQTIANQQSDPNAKDVVYNASLEILYTLLEQTFVIIMGCVPPLRSTMKLSFMQNLSTTFSSLLRRTRMAATRPSRDDSKVSAGMYDDLEMSHDSSNAGDGRFDDLARNTHSLGAVGGQRGVNIVNTIRYERGESQQDLVDPKSIHQTHDFSVTYGNNSEIV